MKREMLIKSAFWAILQLLLILVKQSLQQLAYLIDHYLGWFFTNGNKSRSVLDDGYWE